MSISNLCRSEQNFGLFDHEEGVIRRAACFLEGHPEDLGGLRATVLELIQAFQQSAREQKQLLRAGDRQQEQLRTVSRELKEKSRLLEEQTRHLRILNTDLAHEVEARKALEVDLRILATTDPLTGVYNRRRFLQLGDYELARETRTPQGLSLLALDIDHFKKVNDMYGHGVGDDTLVRFVQACSTCLRAMDSIGRTGGEEFAILLPETTLAESCELAERMRATVAACQMQGDQEPFQVTVSIGVAQSREGEPLDGLMARADLQLYKAKHAGRNRWHAELDPAGPARRVQKAMAGTRPSTISEGSVSACTSSTLTPGASSTSFSPARVTSITA
jgi:diguanylate cyclase (GGDEF)-like protein